MTIEAQEPPNGELRAREARLDLGPAHAHLHVLRLGDYAHLTEAELFARFGGLMSPGETAKQQRYVFEKGRREYLMTRALVRTTLSRYAAAPARAWEFSENPWGRPAVAGPAGVHPLAFNLSNTDGCVVCLVALDREIGVDVERTTRRGETLELVQTSFSPTEIRGLRALPPEAQRDRFFSLWTLKESYIKARGMGLALPLDQFSFLLDGGEPEVGFATEPSLKDDAASWEFAQHRLGPEHLAATAVRLREGAGLAITRIDASFSPALRW
jgi:4'-phosphopantetheinyl transferase